LTRHQRGFKQFTRPVFPSPVAAGWNSEPLGFPPSFEPRQLSTDDARRGGDRPSSTDLERAHDISRTSNQRVRSSACDLVSQALVVPGRPLLLRMRRDQRRVNVERQPLRRTMRLREPRPGARVRDPDRVQQPGRGGDPVDIRNAVESDATAPNNGSCSRTAPRSETHSPPSASITARSRITRPGS
jgi:hypothetical protein